MGREAERASPERASSERTWPGGPVVRVEHVGSLLKPPSLVQAQRRYRRGDLSDGELGDEADAAVAAVVAEQEARGLPLLTDGELRRAPAGAGAGGEGAGWGGSPLDEYAFASKLTSRPLKVAVPAPDRLARGVLSSPDSAHLSLDEALARTVATERRSIDSLVAAGCGHVQVDSPSDSPLDRAPRVALLRGFGRDPLALLAWSIWANNEVVAGVGVRATTALHICFGRDAASGGPWLGLDDPVAERLFADLRHDRLLIDCAGRPGYQWLRFVPPAMTVVLGLVSTRPGTTETVDDLTRQVEEASRFLPVDRLAIGPRCGFSTHFDTETAAADEQWRKLDTLLLTAERVWGGSVTG